MKVTLKDIAQDTGYSISTVSRVLNGFDKTSSKAKKEIIKSARKLNYPMYNNTVSGLDPSGPIDILLLTGFEVGEFYASFFDGLNRAASNEHVRLSFTSLANGIPDPAKVAEKIDREDYSGLIINIPGYTDAHYRKLKDLLPDDFPVVSNEVMENQIFETVGFDNYGGGFYVAEHFHEKKYGTLGIISGPGLKTVSRLRAHGFKDYINNHPDMNLIWEYEGAFTFDSGIEAFKAFEELDEKPRAIFSCNDAMCHAFIEEALVHGYTFPDDIAIVGFDDLPICTRHRPTISSVNTPYEKLGRVTIEVIKETIAQQREERAILRLVPVNLSKRQSS